MFKNKELYRIITDIEPTRLTYLQETEDKEKLSIKTNDPIKLEFWTKLYAEYPDMNINITSERFGRAEVTKGIAIELNEDAEDNFNDISSARILDHLLGLDMTKDIFEPEWEMKAFEREIFNASKKAIEVYLTCVDGYKYEYLNSDFHRFQYIFSPKNKDLICIDPINMICGEKIITPQVP